MKRKKAYQSKDRPAKELVLTGNVYLRYEDDEAIASAVKGDVVVYPVNDSLNGPRLGAYDETGFVGYFKAEVFDGASWCLVRLNEIFPNKEHHFSKKERPRDTYALCADILNALKGKTLLRTYREHYDLSEHAAEDDER